MHDKMRAVLRSTPAGGLDPSAGKARPDQLVLPYDPSFLPENNLPGLVLDVSKLYRLLEADPSQQSSVLLPRTPDISQSALSSNSSLRLNLPSDENLLRDMGGFSSEADMASSVNGGLDFGGLMRSTLNEDGGVLLQPDFEFDEDGNIIELGVRHQSEVRAAQYGNEVRANEMNDFTFDDQPILADEDIEMAITNEPARLTCRALLSGVEGSLGQEPAETEDHNEVTMHQRHRPPKILLSDAHTALRNVELAEMNDEYMHNMAVAAKHKRQNKIPTQAKKKAAYWVFGVGIGSVGAGVGTSRVIHPLHFFSGNELYDCLAPTSAGNKRRLEDDPEANARRVRAREEDDDHMGTIELVDDNNFWNQDVELGRQASPPLDDNSSQMPWNITASVKSSRHGSSAANLFRGFGSVNDFSSCGIPEPAGSSAIGRARKRLTSASPLAGRGFPYDLDRLNGLSIPGHDEDDLEGFDLSQYLEADAIGDTNSNAEAGPSYRSQLALQNSLSESVMDQEGLNFLDFVAAKINLAKSAEDADTSSASNNRITFSTLLPPERTSRAVATHGLMHTLALATKGFLSVRQSAYIDQSSEERGVKYEYGEIFLRLVEV
ncbi:hypothetical protein BDW59DRAFT_158623 [Aspergillus cavernicola]|uniref:Rad21/Rec8-like protein C-terminal eukaryotic domain-containing protein n=1 Tax=Aspergillus cavernicola TaxID=176166 RepID=A0ABR4ISQ6_9EURO